MLLQMARFYPFLWLNNIPRCIYPSLLSLTAPGAHYSSPSSLLLTALFGLYCLHVENRGYGLFNHQAKLAPGRMLHTSSLPAIIIAYVGQVSFNLQRLYTSCCCLVTQSCPILCSPMDCSPPSSSVHGISQQEYCSELPFPSPGDLPDPGIEPVSPHCRRILYH